MKKVLDNPNKGLSFLYNTAAGRIILKPLVNSKVISKLSGLYMDSILSKILIKPFIKHNNINMDEFIDTKYKSFNDFFTRKIKKEKRPVSNNSNDFISPCDSKLTCYKITDDLLFNVKNSIYSVESILNDNVIANKYKNGYVLVFRLSPNDYHRYCFIDNGKVLKHYKIKGKFHTVNPIVYNKYKVFKENTREVTLFKSDNFDDLIYIEVGALLVGKINNYDIKKANKGLEKGYFMYGGSTVIVLVKENIIKLDNMIIDNSKNGFETFVNYGEKIGKKIKKHF